VDLLEYNNVMEEKEEKVCECEERLKLAQFYKAEFENFKKRNHDSAQKAFSDGKEIAILQILPIGDSLQEALKSVETQNDREGIEILIRKFSQVLFGLGVEEIPTVGEKFDPKVHNAIAVKDGKPDKVVEEFQKGYKMAGRLVRPAMVAVGK